jgi:hypothetical protein
MKAPTGAFLRLSHAIFEKGDPMNCYHCLVSPENHVSTAVAVCQRCGSGICTHHLMTLAGSNSAGMSGATTPSIVCSRCFHLLCPSARTQKQARTPKKRSWLQHLTTRGKQQDLKEQILPQPDEAVALIERFLKQQRD